MPPATEPPVYDNTKVTVVFVLGGPGAGMGEIELFFLKKKKQLTICLGKGTQCGRLVEDFDFCHLSG